MSQRGDLLVPKGGDAVFIHSGPMRLLGVLVSFLRVLKSLPGALLPGLVILLLMGLRGSAMSVGGTIVQLGGALMIFVVRSVVIASRH
jgi:hypothetical protein